MIAADDRPPLWRWLLLAAGVVALDQWSKAAIAERLALGEAITLAPFFDLLRTFNTGAAFSFLRDAGGWQRWLFTGIAALASVLIVSMLRRSASARVSLALALVLGGAIGNVVDRVLRGHVIDFLHFHWGPHSFPVFNLADCAITAGAALLLLDELLKLRRT